jgi:hypothetical protein
LPCAAVILEATSTPDIIGGTEISYNSPGPRHLSAARTISASFTPAATPVPEPSSLEVLGAALIGLGAAMKRRCVR